MHIMTLNTFNSTKDYVPTNTVEFDIPSLLSYFSSLQRHCFRTASESKAVSFCCYKENAPSRKKTDILSVSAIVLNINEQLSIEYVAMIEELLAAQQRAYILHTTYSSSFDKYRLRVILPLADHLSPVEYEKNSYALRAAKLLNVPIPANCQYVTQLHALPSCKVSSVVSDDHFLFISKSVQGWSFTDLPELISSDRSKYFEKIMFPDEKDEDAPLEVYSLVTKVVQKLSHNNTPPVSAEGQIYFYNGAVWKGMSKDALIKLILTDVFDRKITLEAAKQVVELIRYLHHVDTFPLSPWMIEGSMTNPLIALGNGTFDPITGMKVKNDSMHYLRSEMAYIYEPKALCPQWLSFLNDTFQPDHDKVAKIAVLQEFMGYLLIPSTKYQKMLWLYGQGSNGKSVVNTVITHLLGEANVSTIPFNDLSKRFKAQSLVGKLANINDEVEANAPLQDQLIKQVVTGNRIEGERKGENTFVFKPYARLVVAMNQFPRIKDTTHGFFRRVSLLTFNRIIEPSEQDKELPRKLLAELAGIFAWSVHGLRRLVSNGEFTEVPSDNQTLIQLKTSTNPIEQFFNDIVIVSVEANGKPPLKTLTSKVYERYREYCAVTGNSYVSNSLFGQGLKSLGVQLAKSSGIRYYVLTMKTLHDAGITSKTDQRLLITSPGIRQIEEEMIA